MCHSSLESRNVAADGDQLMDSVSSCGADKRKERLPNPQSLSSSLPDLLSQVFGERSRRR